MIAAACSLYSLKERLIGKLFRFTNPSDGENALILPPADPSRFGANKRHLLLTAIKADQGLKVIISILLQAIF